MRGFCLSQGARFLPKMAVRGRRCSNQPDLARLGLAKAAELLWPLARVSKSPAAFGVRIADIAAILRPDFLCSKARLPFDACRPPAPTIKGHVWHARPGLSLDGQMPYL